MDEIRERLRELRAYFSEIMGKLDKGLEELEREVEERGRVVNVKLAEELRRSAREARARLLRARVELRAALRRAAVETRPSEAGELEELRDEVEEFFERIGEALEDYLEDLRALVGGASQGPEGLERVIDESLRAALRGVEAAVRRLEEVFKGLGEAAGPTYVVSSIRLPKRDLDVIDLLVEAGVFRSRSEAVAYFTHKGLEVAKPALEELLAKLRELKELREKLREEVKKAFEEGGGRSG